MIPIISNRGNWSFRVFLPFTIHQITMKSNKQASKNNNPSGNKIVPGDPENGEGINSTSRSIWILQMGLYNDGLGFKEHIDLSAPSLFATSFTSEQQKRLLEVMNDPNYFRKLNFMYWSVTLNFIILFSLICANLILDSKILVVLAIQICSALIVLLLLAINQVIQARHASRLNQLSREFRSDLKWKALIWIWEIPKFLWKWNSNGILLELRHCRDWCMSLRES